MNIAPEAAATRLTPTSSAAAHLRAGPGPLHRGLSCRCDTTRHRLPAAGRPAGRPARPPARPCLAFLRRAGFVAEELQRLPVHSMMGERDEQKLCRRIHSLDFMTALPQTTHSPFLRVLLHAGRGLARARPHSPLGAFRTGGDQMLGPDTFPPYSTLPLSPTHTNSPCVSRRSPLCEFKMQVSQLQAPVGPNEGRSENVCQVDRE